MLSLPSKPWKRVRIDDLGNGELRLTFLSDLESEAQFEEVVQKDIVPSLDTKDRLVGQDWPSRSVVVQTLNPAMFKRNLVFACIMVEIE